MDTGALFFIVFGCFVVYAFSRIASFKGLKGAMFGARIEAEVGEVRQLRDGFPAITVTARVHALSGKPDRAVGLEIVAKSLASYQMMPIALSASDADMLADFLKQAAERARKA